MGSATFGLVVTIVVTLAIALLVLLLERRRARHIEADLRRRPGGDGHSDGARE